MTAGHRAAFGGAVRLVDITKNAAVPPKAGCEPGHLIAARSGAPAPAVSGTFDVAPGAWHYAAASSKQASRTASSSAVHSLSRRLLEARTYASYQRRLPV